MAGSHSVPGNVPVVNGNFENPEMPPNTFTDYVPGWQLVDSVTSAGVFHPTYAITHTFEGKNVLYINRGGVTQVLPIAVRGMTDYSVTLNWQHRKEMMLGSVAVQLVAGDQVLASCAPPYGPDRGKSATVTLIYHNGATNDANGQPLSIRILKLNRAIPTPIFDPAWGTQVDVDDVQVTATDHEGPPPLRAFECSISVADPLPGRVIAPQSPTIDVTVMNPSFEIPLPWEVGAGNATGLVPGWAAFEGSSVGIWNPTTQFSSPTPIDGGNVLFMNSGGVSQLLPVRLQPLADYTFSLNWGHRLDMMSGGLVLQLVAGDQVLATCAPSTLPEPGSFVNVKLAYHSDGSSSAIGEPITIHILKLPQDAGTQVDVDDVHVTFTDLTGTPRSAIDTVQECSTALLSQ